MSQQHRGEFHAPAVAQAVLLVRAGFHWTASGLVLYAETHTVWNQLCAVHLLPAESHHGGPGSLLPRPAWGEPGVLCRPSAAEVGHLCLRSGTGDCVFIM